MGAVSDADPGVELDGLTVRFGDLVALDGVSLAVEPGEFFTLVGPSGCGKTTTLRAIAGFEPPASGTVRIGGADVTGLPPEDRDVGIVFQHYALFPHLSVSENVAYGLRYRDPPGDATADERVAELLDLVDLAGMGDREPDALSGGQQQRVALARALAPGPDVLLLDEPLSALDARLRQRLRVTVREIQQDLGITTVYVTHDQAEALAISDRVAVLHGGRIEQVGPPEAVYREPASRFVAEFVGDNNVFEATVASLDPPSATVSGGSIPLPADAGVTVGEAVVVAVRPEHLVVGGGTATLEATVSTVEFLGDAYRIHCDWRDRTLLVTADQRLEPGEPVAIGVDPDRVSLVARGAEAGGQP
ncbi:MAG: ABC transporter ATP-binding protein [Halobacteriales archaeon]